MQFWQGKMTPASWNRGQIIGVYQSYFKNSNTGAFLLSSAFKINHPEIKAFYFAAENLQEMNM